MRFMSGYVITRDSEEAPKKILQFCEKCERVGVCELKVSFLFRPPRHATATTHTPVPI
jgi:hypothetical protein